MDSPIEVGYGQNRVKQIAAINRENLRKLARVDHVDSPDAALYLVDLGD